MTNNNEATIELDINDIIKNMSDQIAKQAQEIAVLNATVLAYKKALTPAETSSEE